MCATEPEPQTAPQEGLKTRRLILHAGMQKTGSTSIQHFLNAATLRNAQYFKGPKANHSVLYLMLFSDAPQDHRMNRIKGRNRKQVNRMRKVQEARIAAALNESDIATHVFSAERISKSSRDEMQRCRDFFAPWFPEIALYAYVRSPMKFAASMFQQHLKFGRLPTLKNSVPSYRARIGNFDAVFGAEHVHLRAFDAMDAPISDIVADFLDWTGVKAEGDVTGQRNLSLSGDATALIYALRRKLETGLKTAEDVKAWARLIGKAGHVGQNGYLFEPALFGDLTDEIEADRDWTETRLGQRFATGEPSGSRPVLRFSGLEEVREHGREVFERITGQSLKRALAQVDGPVTAAVLSELVGDPQPGS